MGWDEERGATREEGGVGELEGKRQALKELKAKMEVLEGTEWMRKELVGQKERNEKLEGLEGWLAGGGGAA